MSLGAQFSVFLGCYVWCLELGCDYSRISRVFRKKGRGVTDVSFEGTLEECRRFQLKNGGATDGVILVDDLTNIKVLGEVDSISIPGYKENFFENVDSIDGVCRIGASRDAVDAVAEKVRKAGFSILKHVPAAFYVADTIQKDNQGSSLCYFVERDCMDFFFVQDHTLIAYYRLTGGDTEKKVQEVASYIRENYLVKELSVDVRERVSVACAAAEDLWLFHSDKMRGFSSPTSGEALAQIKQSALFRRTLKACTVILVMSLLMVAFFRCGVMYYGYSNEGKIQEYTDKLKKRKQLAELEAKLEKDRDETEVFLAHRSRYATSMKDIVAAVPADLWITKWNVENHTHIIQGQASTSGDVSMMLQALEHMPGFFNARLRSTEKTTYRRNPVVKFEILVEDNR
jgi:hypothetical protein